MKLRSSTKIAIGFAAVCAGGFYGYRYITDRMILGEKFEAVPPGIVTLLGVDPGSGFRIIVANDVAALVTGDFGDLEVGEMRDSATETDTRKRLPMKAMLDILQGDEKPLGRFIMSINDIKEGGQNWPTNAPYWNGEDVEKALGGDAKLRAKLESDLNVRLDGTPLDVVRISALQNGIILRLPVPVQVKVGPTNRTMVGRVLEPYRPHFSLALEERLNERYITPAMLRGNYVELAREAMADASQREDVARSLKIRLDPDKLKTYAKAPSNVLSTANIILNESFIEGASYTEIQGQSGRKRYKLVLDLTDEGRRRLWQYSKLRRGTQLLFVVNGTAIAAPVVASEFPWRQVSITNLPSEDLVREAVETLNEIKKGRKS